MGWVTMTVTGSLRKRVNSLGVLRCLFVIVFGLCFGVVSLENPTYVGEARGLYPYGPSELADLPRIP